MRSRNLLVMNLGFKLKSDFRVDVLRLDAMKYD